MVNDSPVAEAQTVVTNEDTAASITLTASDPDGDALTYAVVVQPVYGILTGSAPNLIYTPNADYNGADSFTFKANDGLADSNVATVSITVTAVNDAPVIIENDPVQVTMSEDGSPDAFALTLSATDIDGNTLIWSVSQSAGNGSASVTDGVVSYSPEANYFGSDSFKVEVSDGTLSDTVTVNVAVESINDAPVIAGNDPVALTVAEDGSGSSTLSASDADADTWSIGTAASEGQASVTNGEVSYTPNANYNGNDSFTVSVSDGTATDSVTVNVTVTAVNDAPTTIALNNSTVAENEPAGTVVGTLSATDVDSDNFSYGLVSGTGDGDNASFTIAGASLKTAASFDYETKNSYGVRVQVDDGAGGTFAQSLTVTVTDVAEGLSASSLAAGNDHTCALGSDSKAYCWGYGYNGQLGNGTTTSSTTPTVVSQPQ